MKKKKRPSVSKLKKKADLAELSTETYNCDKCKQYEFITLINHPGWMIQIRFNNEIIDNKGKYELILCERCSEEFFLCKYCKAEII